MLDVAIRNGTVVDGTGADPFAADVGVADGRVVAIGRVAQAHEELDAAGLLVAPGFIDIHSHSDYTLLVDPRAVSAIAQGVTTEVVGNCGFGCGPIRDPASAAGSIYGFDGSLPLDWGDLAGYLARVEAARPAVNLLTLVPNGQLRRSVIGVAERPATPDELARMTALLEAGLEAGAFGYSTGLEYAAERGATAHEIGCLCRATARRGGFYATHTRRRDAGAVEAIEEALRTAQDAGIRLQISHILPRKVDEREGERALALVDDARRVGQDVAFDMHTRLYGTTFLSALVPPWAFEGGREALAARLASSSARAEMRNYPSIVAGGGFDRVVLLDHPGFSELSRRSLGEVARERGADPFDLAFDVLLADVDDINRAMVIIRTYSADDQAPIFAHPLCMPGSDATTLAPDGPLARSMFHGAYSWAAWFWDFMVRERALLTPAEAVHRMTGLPASVLGLSGRGRLAEGAHADISVFDPARFAPRATTFEPNQLAEGMVHVLVNGIPALRDGTRTTTRGGVVLRRSG
jgi:N-acyl-D-aspartate/D-glutamate deacylase